MNHQRLFGILAITVSLAFNSLALAQNAPSCQNLLRNGSFEEGPDPGSLIVVSAGSQTMPAWTVERDTVDFIGTYFPSAHGKRHIDLDGSPGFGIVSQTFQTQPGKRYKLTFSMAGNNAGPPDIKRISVQVGNASRVFTHGRDLNWKTESLEFTANSANTTLKFISLNNTGDYYGALIDNVRVIPLDAQAPSETATAFSGKWSTNWGDMELQTSGNRVTGTYVHDKGRLSGTMSADGKTFTGRWAEYPSYAGSSDSGGVIFRLSEDGKSLRGTWGYGDKSTGGDWTASRKEDPLTACQDTPPALNQTSEEPLKKYTIQGISLDQREWQNRMFDLQRESLDMERKMESLKRVASEQLTRVQHAFNQAEAVKSQKQALDQRIIAQRKILNDLENPPREIPANARTLVQQRDFVAQSIKQTEDQILALPPQNRGQQATRLIATLDSLKEQLARIEAALKEKLPPLPDRSAEIAQARQTLDNLTDQFWALRKQETHAISELDIANNLLAATLRDIDTTKDEWFQIETQKRQLDANGTPFVEQVQVLANQQPVYQAEWRGPFEELQKKDQEIQKMTDAVRHLKETKDSIFADFKAKAQQASDTLSILHGDSVSQGNGVWATLTDLVHNNGAIMDTARANAAVDFGLNAYEVFVEGWGRGGPAGALIETLHKVAMAGVQYGLEDASGVLDSENFVYQDGLYEANTQLGAGTSNPLTTAEVAKTAIYRTIEDGLTRHGRELGNQTLGVNLARRFAQSDRLQFARMMGQPGIGAEALKAQGEKLNQHRRRLMQLGQREAYSAGGLGSSLIKDALKTAVKAYYQGVENSLWESFVLTQATQVNLYRTYQEAAENYWNGYDQLQKLKKERADLVYGYNPQTGFRVVKNEPFDEKAALQVQVILKQPQGHQEQVALGGIVAGNGGSPHTYVLQAKALPHAGNPNPAPVQLSISQR